MRATTLVMYTIVSIFALGLFQVLPKPALAQVTEATVVSSDENEVIPESELKFRPVKGFPKWSEFPSAPVNVPKTNEIKRQVTDAEAARYQLQELVSQLNWSELTVQDLAQSSLARLDPKRSQPIEEGLTSAQIEAIAVQLRKRAQAPPPIDKY